MLICDTHADTLFALQDEARDPDKSFDITAERLTAGGENDVRVQAFALWTGPEGLRGKDVGLIDREMQVLERLQKQGYRQVRTLEEAQAGQPNILLTIEGGEAFESCPQTVDAFALWGVRLAAIVWNNENSFAYPAMGKNDHGLTTLGRRLVARMNKRHMGVDVSHLNAAGVKDALNLSKNPILASHSCCRALCDHPRNLTDEQLKALFAMDGYVGVNFFPMFLSPDQKAGIDTVVNHIDHMAQLGGEKHIGMGSDFDGIGLHPEGLEHAGCVYTLFERMKARGFSDEAITDFAGENFRRYLARL
ncbi:MAG: dipeptidase [Eubacteriales bacterium]|nr:dipeptidase [Eubacteriales bacterium]